MHKVIFVLHDTYTIYCVLKIDSYRMMYIRRADQLPKMLPIILYLLLLRPLNGRNTLLFIHGQQ